MPDIIIAGMLYTFFALGALFTIVFMAMLIVEDWR